VLDKVQVPSVLQPKSKPAMLTPPYFTCPVLVVVESDDAEEAAAVEALAELVDLVCFAEVVWAAVVTGLETLVAVDEASVVVPGTHWA